MEITDDSEWQLDHLIPQSSRVEGMTLEPLNIVFAHTIINTGRGNMEAAKFARALHRIALAVLGKTQGSSPGFFPRALVQLQKLKEKVGWVEEVEEGGDGEDGKGKEDEEGGEGEDGEGEEGEEDEEGDR